MKPFLDICEVRRDCGSLTNALLQPGAYYLARYMKLSMILRETGYKRTLGQVLILINSCFGIGIHIQLGFQYKV